MLISYALSYMISLGVSGSRDVSGLSCDFGCHVPPDVVALSFKLKAETLISWAASNLHDVECQLCDGCQECTHISKTLVPSSARHFTHAAVYTCDPMISSICSETLVDAIIMMTRKNFMRNRRDNRIL
jgi:hypothetical protein